MQTLHQSAIQEANASASRPARARKRWRAGARWLLIVFCLAPSLALFFIFVILPLVQAVYYSFFNWNGLGPLNDFQGLKNYVVLLQDPIFQGAVKDNLIIVVLSLLIQLPFALTLALLLRERVPGTTFFRLIFFLPYVLSQVVAGLIWLFIYDPSTGLVSGLFKLLRPDATPPALLGDPHTVLYAIFVVMTWQYFGFHFVLYLAGLQNIPVELTEAAFVDGATPWQALRAITLPLLGSTLRLSMFFSILGSLQYFDLIFVMSDGGPVNASETMATYLVHKGFQSFQMGYGSAVGAVLFLICFVFAFFYQRWIMHQDLVGTTE
jgi:raffinose/stachyose/melibiose transport system permease protein